MIREDTKIGLKIMIDTQKDYNASWLGRVGLMSVTEMGLDTWLDCLNSEEREWAEKRWREEFGSLPSERKE